jgi:hypothetical protein
MKRNSAVSGISESSGQAEFQPDRHSCIRMRAAQLSKDLLIWMVEKVARYRCVPAVPIVLALGRGGTTSSVSLLCTGWGCSSRTRRNHLGARQPSERTA